MAFEYTPPKYAQVVAEIRRRIETGIYPPGALIPSEHELVGEFEVSRPTIVKALTVLRHEGWVRTQQGRGSFANARPHELVIQVPEDVYQMAVWAAGNMPLEDVVLRMLTEFGARHEDAVDSQIAREALDDMAHGEPSIPWEQVKAELDDEA